MDKCKIVFLSSNGVSVPFHYQHGLVIFDANGPDEFPLVVELDTCTTPNAVRHDLAVRQGWSTENTVESYGIIQKSPDESHEAEIPFIQLGRMKIYNLYAHTDPLGGPASPDVMLGERFLREVVVSLDFNRCVATFYPVAKWVSPPKTEQCAVLDLDTEIGGIPCIRNQVTINGIVKVSTALLDTGFNDAVLLSPNLADQVGIRAGVPGIEAVGSGGYGGPTTLLRGNLDEIIIGSFKLKNINAYRPPEGSKIPFVDSSWAIIGNKIFEKFTATVTWALTKKKFIIEL
ncbi:retropepsin-like domain-containing protein [bacterium]|nr:retropepsin-like domain-containing protein [bacterium]